MPFAGEWGSGAAPAPPVPSSGGSNGVTLFQGLLPVFWEALYDAGLSTKVTWLANGSSALPSTSNIRAARWSPQGVTTDAGRFSFPSHLAVRTGVRLNFADNPALLAHFNPGCVIKKDDKSTYLRFQPPGDVILSVLTDFSSTPRRNNFWLHVRNMLGDDAKDALDDVWEDVDRPSFHMSWGDASQPSTGNVAALLGNTTAPSGETPSGDVNAGIAAGTQATVYREHKGAAYGDDFCVYVAGMFHAGWPYQDYMWLTRPSSYEPPAGTPGLYLIA